MVNACIYIELSSKALYNVCAAHSPIDTHTHTPIAAITFFGGFSVLLKDTFAFDLQEHRIEPKTLLLVDDPLSLSHSQHVDIYINAQNVYWC